MFWIMMWIVVSNRLNLHFSHFFGARSGSFVSMSLGKLCFRRVSKDYRSRA